MSDTHMNTGIDDLIHVLDEYARWFSGILSVVFYPDQTMKTSTRHIDAFNDWLSRQADNNSLRAISAAEQKCVAVAQKVLDQKTPPPQDKFDDFISAYNNFVKLIRQYARNMVIGSAHIDPVTGLRTEDMARQEFKRELDRVTRDGKLFSVALLYINNHEAKSFVKITELIKRSIRSFDDAYILDNGNILLLFKQADSTGGVRALKRLKEMLSNNKDIPETVKVLSCIATPGDGDHYQTLVENMRARLDREPKDQQRILEYVELSPVERFMQQNDGC
jgi:diguanylate cyclase